MTDPSALAGDDLADRLRRLGLSARRSSLLRNAGKLGAAEVVGLMASLVQALVLARTLGPRAYGTAALILALPAFVFTFFDPQASEAVVKYLGAATAKDDGPRARGVIKVAYLVDASLALVGIAVVAACAPWAADRILGSDSQAGLLVVAASCIGLAAPADTSRAVLSTFGRFSAVAWVDGANAAARAALVIGLVSAGHGVAGVVVGTGAGLVAQSLLLGGLAHACTRRATGESWLRGRRDAIRPQLREMGRFLLYTDLTSLAAVFVKQADLVVLGAVRGPVDAGWYRLAQSLTTPVSSLVAALQAVAYPAFSRLVGVGDVDGVARAARRYFLKVGLPLAALTLAGTVAVPTAVRLVGGAAFAPAVPAARWLLVGSAFVIAGFWARPAMYATGQVRFVFFMSTVLGSATVAGFVLAADPFGSAGVASSRALLAGALGTVVLAFRFRQLWAAGALGRGGPGSRPADDQ